jgi:hypothetical protein
MFEHPEKSVVRSPFRLSRDPFSLSTRTIREIGKSMADIQYRPTVSKVPRLVWSVLRS